MKSLNLLFLLFFSLLSLATQAQDKHPLSAEDLVRFERVMTPVVSPDGTMAAFVVRETDIDANQGYSDIWLIDLGATNAKPRRLTLHEENDVMPRWARDGKSIYFLSDRSGLWQIWMMNLATRGVSQISDFPVEVTSFELSLKNKTIAFTAGVYPGCQTLSCTYNLAKILEQNPEKGQVYDKNIIRYWDKWRTGLKSQLFVVPVNRKGEIKEEPQNVLKSIDAEVPIHHNEVANYVFSKDGEDLYFSTQIQGQDEAWSVNSDIYKFQLDGRRGLENLTGDNPAEDIDPIISPDGKWLAWRATNGPKRFAADYKIKLMNLKTGDVKTLGQGWDRSPVFITFSKKSSAILALTDHLGQRVIWQVPLDSTAPKLVAEGGQVMSVHDSAYGVLYDQSDLQHPASLFLKAEGQPRQLTNFNAARLAMVEMGDFDQFSFVGAHGDLVYGYVVHPVNYVKSGKYPVAMIIHGGPHGTMGNSFSYRWNPQFYAGAGYAVVFIDYHGSTGYGQGFVESIHGDRGGATIEDNQLGLAEALSKFPWFDGDRMCALGASFGGYMMNLIEGDWPDRFKCLVNHDGMFDNRMKYYSGDINGYLEEGFGGKPYYEDPESHEMFNPVTGVARWQTPMLVIHSEKDYRVPITQSIGAFTALQRRGIASRFLYFPDENHWVLGPANSLQWHREVLGWLDRWLKP